HQQRSQQPLCRGRVRKAANDSFASSYLLVEPLLAVGRPQSLTSVRGGRYTQRYKWEGFFHLPADPDAWIRSAATKLSSVQHSVVLVHSGLFRAAQNAEHDREESEPRLPFTLFEIR